MFGFTKRLAGWAAGRLKGEKARKKTMDWMEKTGVGKVLGGLGDAALLGGAGKLAGMGAAKLGFGKGVANAANAGQTAASVGAPAGPYAVSDLSQFSRLPGSAASTASSFTPGAASQAIQRMAPSMMDQATQVAPSFLQRAGSMAGQAGSYLAKRPEIAAAGFTALSQAQQGAANRAMQERQFNLTYEQAEAERQREIERQQRIAQMLAPLFQRIAGGQG